MDPVTKYWFLVPDSFRARREDGRYARDHQCCRSLALASGHTRPRQLPACESTHPCGHGWLSPARLAGLCAVAVQLVGAGLGRRRALPLRDARHQHWLSSPADASWVRLPTLAGAWPNCAGRVLLAGYPHELGSDPPDAPPALR